MASSSIFIYQLISPEEINLELLYSQLKRYSAGNNAYFNLEMISQNELLGEYIIVNKVQETYFDPKRRTFESHVVSKANIIFFTITDSFLEIWGNKTYANKLVFELSKLISPISIINLQVRIDSFLEKVRNSKIKISKVCFKDVLFAKDIVGNFTVDLSSYGDPFSIVKKYCNKISSITIILYLGLTSIKLRITAKGRVFIYKARAAMDDEELLFLHHILLNGGR